MFTPKIRHLPQGALPELFKSRILSILRHYDTARAGEGKGTPAGRNSLSESLVLFKRIAKGQGSARRRTEASSVFGEYCAVERLYNFRIFLTLILLRISQN